MAEQINWSFTYEKNKTTSVHTAYAKAINFCKSHGPSPYYDEFIEAMNKIAEAARGGDEKEGGVINSFSKDLIEQFQHDLDKSAYDTQWKSNGVDIVKWCEWIEHISSRRGLRAVKC